MARDAALAERVVGLARDVARLDAELAHVTAEAQAAEVASWSRIASLKGHHRQWVAKRELAFAELPDECAL